MSKKIFILVAAVAFLGLAIRPAAAEIKNLKVGGDIVIRGIYRDNLEFDKTGPKVGSWAMTQTRVYFSAELTDNVFGLIRVINERDWDINTTASDDIDLDLAYIKAVDLLTPGLTLTLGRQEILLGDGFVVGNRNFNGADLGSAGLTAPDLSARKAFDAVRVDYEVGMYPLTLTLIGAKINDVLPTSGTGERDTDLRGLNARYDIADNASVESYVLNLHEKQDVKSVDIWTFGVRGEHEVYSVPGLAYSAEVAFQNGDSGLSVQKDQKAYAFNMDVNYAFANPYEPKIGIGYTYLSGDKNSSDSDNKAWEPIFPDNLGDRIGALHYAAVYNNTSLTGNNGSTNLSVPKVYGSFKPAEKHLVSLSVFPSIKTAEKVATDKKKDIGYEIDLGYTYQYTDDLSFGLLLGYMKADDLIKANVGASDFDDKAIQVIGTAALAF